MADLRAENKRPEAFTNRRRGLWLHTARSNRTELHLFSFLRVSPARRVGWVSFFFSLALFRELRVGPLSLFTVNFEGADRPTGGWGDEGHF